MQTTALSNDSFIRASDICEGSIGQEIRVKLKAMKGMSVKGEIIAARPVGWIYKGRSKHMGFEIAVQCGKVAHTVTVTRLPQRG